MQVALRYGGTEGQTPRAPKAHRQDLRVRGLAGTGLPPLYPHRQDARFHGLADAKSQCADLQPLDAAATDVVDSAHNLALP